MKFDVIMKSLYSTIIQILKSYVMRHHFKIWDDSFNASTAFVMTLSHIKQIQIYIQLNIVGHQYGIGSTNLLSNVYIPEKKKQKRKDTLYIEMYKWLYDIKIIVTNKDFFLNVCI